jgi:hypothetical protein
MKSQIIRKEKQFKPFLIQIEFQTFEEVSFFADLFDFDTVRKVYTDTFAEQTNTVSDLIAKELKEQGF